MNPQRLWAPWRATFIRQASARTPGCIFCQAKRTRQHDRMRHVVARGEWAFALLNRFPYNNGHLMIAPYRHVGRLMALEAAEWAEMLRLGRRLIMRLDRGLRPHGYNMGINEGRAAGAGIPGHLHLHIVPRWSGDTNFMPAVGGTKVISESLDELYALLTGASGRSM